jgi:hypothetical protein
MNWFLKLFDPCYHLEQNLQNQVYKIEVVEDIELKEEKYWNNTFSATGDARREEE